MLYIIYSHFLIKKNNKAAFADRFLSTKLAPKSEKHTPLPLCFTTDKEVETHIVTHVCVMTTKFF